jgi:hypothetical protein
VVVDPGWDVQLGRQMAAVASSLALYRGQRAPVGSLPSGPPMVDPAAVAGLGAGA